MFAGVAIARVFVAGELGADDVIFAVQLAFVAAAIHLWLSRNDSRG